MTQKQYFVTHSLIVMRSFTCEQKKWKTPTKDEHAALVDDGTVVIPRGRGWASRERPTYRKKLL